MQEIMQWCEISNYSTERVKNPIKSDNLEKNLNNPKNYHFIKNYDVFNGDRLKNLIEGSTYWQIYVIFSFFYFMSKFGIIKFTK